MTLPAQFLPMEPVLAREPFDDPRYLYQVKWDGVRMVAFIDGSSVRLQNRRLHPRTDTYPDIVAELSAMGLKETIVDGEIIAFDGDRPSFSRVMRRDSSAGQNKDLIIRIPVVYVIFDLVHYNGEPIISRPLYERLTILRHAVRPADRVLVTDDHESGTALFDVMTARGWEGIVAKHKLGPYCPGTKSPDWQKIKIRHSERFRVAGYVSRRGRLVTLLLADETDGRYAGRAGTGLSDRERERAAAYLESAAQTPGPNIRLKPGETGRWVDTDLVVQVEFQEWTDAHSLRAPVITALGLPAGTRGVEVMPVAEKAVIDDREFTVRNLDKVLFPADGFTKAHLIEYYLAVSDAILPHLKDRPLVFTRYPDGIDNNWFYQKDLMAGAPDWVQTYPHRTKDRTIEFCICPDRGTLGWIASQACIEIHPWMSRTGSVACPDYAAFDLDPAEPAGFDDAREAAVRIRSILTELGIDALLKTSGATGLHLYVPILSGHSYDQTRLFVKEVAEIMLSRHPGLITLERPVRKRTGKVYIDYLQIYRGKTLAGPYSVRPHPGAPVSTPLRWEELDRVEPGQFTIETVPARIADNGDLFAGVLAGTLRLPDPTGWRT